MALPKQKFPQIKSHDNHIDMIFLPFMDAESSITASTLTWSNISFSMHIVGRLLKLSDPKNLF